jgi:hypothetical protein
MSAKKELPLQTYINKLQEAADKVANERNVVKIEVIHLSGDKFACAREGEQLCLSILNEALSRVNEKYELKAEA